MSTLDLVNAIKSKDAIAIETAFRTVMAEKISTRLDDMRQDVAQRMFAEQEEITEEGKKPSLGVLAAKHFEHTINATHGHNFDLSDKQMASHAKKAHAVKSEIEKHHGAEAAKDTHEHSHMAADHEEGNIGGDTGFHHEFAKKHLGGVNSPEHKKYKAQIDKQDLKMHGDTGVSTHHEAVVKEETISEEADEAHAFAKSMVAKHKGMKHEYDKENDVHVLHGHKRGDEVTNYIEIKHAGPGKVHYYHQSDGHYEVHKKDMSHEDAHKQITKAWKHGDVEDSK